MRFDTNVFTATNGLREMREKSLYAPQSQLIRYL